MNNALFQNLKKEKKPSWPDKLDWLKILVSYDTTSSASNLPLINHIRTALTSIGLNPHLSSEIGIDNKSNLFVTIPAVSGSYQGGILLSGHTDTVPVTGQQWHSDPFTLLDKIEHIRFDSRTKSSPIESNSEEYTAHAGEPQERRLYGRGTCDMKGFIAVCLAYIPEIMEARLSIPVHIALSYDEEVGCLGVPFMIADCQARGIKPDLCIVGEPTSMLPVVAHKSVHSFLCQIHGYAAHSSLTPYGVNAIEYAARLVSRIQKIANAKHRGKIFDENFDIPFTTTQTGLIKGGNAINTVPEYCEFSFELRTICNDEVNSLLSQIKKYSNKLLNEMHTFSKDTYINFTQLESIPALEPSKDPFLEIFLKEFDGCHNQRKVAYATEAGIFAEANIPTLVCGPGSIQQAHRANEYVTFSQLKKCEFFLKEVLHFFQKNNTKSDM